MMEYFVWLSLALGAGNRRAAKVLTAFPNPEDLYRLSIDQRRELHLFTEKELRRLEEVPLKDAVRIVKDCDKRGIKLLAFGGRRYPYCLSVLDDAPVVLYYLGNLPDFDSLPAITIVGPRKAGEFGKKAAYALGYRLSRAGMIVVSGGALGCDTYAHIGALKARGTTVLVMGCGFGCRYLPENEPLRRRVAETGCLMTEYPPGTPASKYTFPARNRILAALSVGTVVVEAEQRSGTLITATHAMEQGRDVFVIPGSPDLPQYTGSNALLRDGAKPLLDVSDIFNEYLLRFPDKLDIQRAFEPVEKTQKQSKSPVHKKLSIETLSKQAQIVYNQIRKPKFYPEEIEADALTREEIVAALTELEIETLIKALPGGAYALIDE